MVRVIIMGGGVGSESGGVKVDGVSKGRCGASRDLQSLLWFMWGLPSTALSPREKNCRLCIEH